MKTNFYIFSQEHIKQINYIKSFNKKRKLENEELKSCCENSKNVIDKINNDNKKLKIENQNLKEKIIDLQKLLDIEKNINTKIKNTELFKTWRYMDDLQQNTTNIHIRKDGLPSKNSITSKNSILI